MKLLKVCAEPTCTELTRGVRCPAHEAKRNARRMAEPHRWVYADPRWARIRRRVLREEPRCRRCGAPSVHIDHIVPLRAGGAPFDRANLQALCPSCHSSKTARGG